MLLQRRPPTTTLIAVGGAVCFFFLLLQLCRSSPYVSGSGFFQTEGRPSSGLLQDIFNSTLGVSSYSARSQTRIEHLLILTFAKFEKIYIVNLPARSDHRDHMALAAAVSDLEVEFRDGVVGSTVLDKVLPPPGSRQRLKDGEIGCWRAHMDILQQ
jgi:hypothetical protein